MATEFIEKDYSLILCRRKYNETQNELLLGLKKRGFGVGKWDGFGGKQEVNETIEECARRELSEESGLRANVLNCRGFIVFKMIEMGLIMRVHIYECWDFEGEAKETEEMRPVWYKECDIPSKLMWPDHSFWLPKVLDGKSIIARFEYEDDDTISDYSIKEN